MFMLINEYTYVRRWRCVVMSGVNVVKLNPAGHTARSGTSVVSGARVPTRYLNGELRVSLFKRNNIIPPGRSNS